MTFATVADALREGGMELATRADLKIGLAELEARIGLLRWMIGFLLALGVANLWLLIRLAPGGPGG